MNPVDRGSECELFCGKGCEVLGFLILHILHNFLKIKYSNKRHKIFFNLFLTQLTFFLVKNWNKFCPFQLYFNKIYYALKRVTLFELKALLILEDFTQPKTSKLIKLGFARVFVPVRL